MNCATCRWSAMTTEEGPLECRRRAPVVIEIDPHCPMTWWPIVEPDQWCGAFEEQL